MRLSKLLFLGMLLLISSLLLNAAVPPIINYQGKLSAADGKPLADGAYPITFAIYAVPTGGTALWSEPYAAVQVKGGLFSVLLGSVVNLPANIFDAPDRFFGVKVGVDAEMTPRQPISSVPFAMKAGISDSVIDGAITTEKIADGAVTNDKLAGGELFFGNSILPSRANYIKSAKYADGPKIVIWHYFYAADFSSWEKRTTGGIVSPLGEGAYIHSGDAPGNTAAVYTTNWAPLGDSSDITPARFIARWRSSTNVQGFNALIRIGVSGLSDTETSGTGGEIRGCGFKQVGPNLYAYLDAGDGAGQQLHLIETIPAIWTKYLGEVMREGNTLYYYLNGQLKYQTAVPYEDFAFGRISLVSRNAGTTGVLDVNWVMKMGWGH